MVRNRVRDKMFMIYSLCCCHFQKTFFFHIFFFLSMDNLRSLATYFSTIWLTSNLWTVPLTSSRSMPLNKIFKKDMILNYPVFFFFWSIHVNILIWEVETVSSQFLLIPRLSLQIHVNLIHIHQIAKSPNTSVW